MNMTKTFRTQASRRDKRGFVSRRLTILAVVATAALAFLFADGAVSHASGPNPDAGNPHKNELIVQFRDRDAFDHDQGHRGVGQVVDENSELNSRLLRVPDVAAARTALLRNPHIIAVEGNSQVTATFDPNDTFYSSQWHLKERSATNGSNLRSAWNLTKGYSGARIVIVDTGIDANHPDLKGRIAYGENFNPDRLRTAYGDCNGHGTAVAGVAAASTNNVTGVAGADMLSQIYVARISSGCTKSSDFYTMARAISTSSGWSGVKVINVSFGGYGTDGKAELQKAINLARSRGVVVVASAGNDNTNQAMFPAALDGVLAVGATNSSGAKASFSNWGWPNVNVTAPGEYICTTDMVSGGFSTTSYACVNGTSFASPLVAGIAMLVRSRYPNASEASIRTWIQEASFNPARGCWNCYSDNYGYGIVDAYWAAY